ncbi:ABC transporter substrate-binding protein [Actinobacillus equuli]|nr:ABC transporter substrate-binding protein [Actinobacillus equuli]
MLANSGLAAKDVELVNVNWSLSPSLISGQVDAIIGGFRNFELNQMQLENKKVKRSLWKISAYRFMKN